MGVARVMVPQNRWLFHDISWKIPMKNVDDDWGNPHFRKPPFILPYQTDTLKRRWFIEWVTSFSKDQAAHWVHWRPRDSHLSVCRMFLFRRMNPTHYPFAILNEWARIRLECSVWAGTPPPPCHALMSLVARICVRWWSIWTLRPNDAMSLTAYTGNWVIPELGEVSAQSTVPIVTRQLPTTLLRDHPSCHDWAGYSIPAWHGMEPP